MNLLNFFTCIWIRRIQNPAKYNAYNERRKEVARKRHKDEHEVEVFPLWHGASKDTVPMITNDKFDRNQSKCMYVTDI